MCRFAHCIVGTNMAIRVRMYRTGFGDCFLLTFRSAGAVAHILVDFGVHPKGEVGTLGLIMDNLEFETQRKLAVVVASHVHRDHVSGFDEFAQRFSRFSIGEIWLPWTENPDDVQARALNKKQSTLLGVLDHRFRLYHSASTDPRLIAALHALTNLRGNERAMRELRRGFATGADVRYLKFGALVNAASAIPGLNAEILGPPDDEMFLRRMIPPVDQRYLEADYTAGSSLAPFKQLEVRTTDPTWEELSNQPRLSSEDIDRLADLAAATDERLAFTLDNIRNNTSLVILFRFEGRTVLFPGDAQWGSWQQWMAEEDGRRIAAELDFLKVSHHGSENATPMQFVDNLPPDRVAVVIPTHPMPFPTIPRIPLISALEERCLGKVAVRSDFINVEGTPHLKHPKLPRGFKKGKVWIDYVLPS
jgi:hypothetical protein